MKKIVLLMLVVCILLSGCSSASVEAKDAASEEKVPAAETTAETAADPKTVIYPLPDAGFNLTDATLSISLEEGDAYVDDTGKMQMDVKLYAYDKYDMVDISRLKVGDILTTNAGEVEVTSLDRRENGTVSVNGGLYEDGFDLVTDDDGVYYESGYNDAKNWYEIGAATIRVSVDFLYYDTSDLDRGEIVYYPGSFLIGEVTDYNFTPYNTTIRVENGQIVEMHRVYVP